MKKALRLSFLLLFLTATIFVFSAPRYVSSISKYSSLYEEETGYRVDISYTGPQLFWTVITLSDNKGFSKRISLVDQSTNVYMDHIPRQMNIKIESYSSAATASESTNISKRSPKSNPMILLIWLGIPFAFILLTFGLVILIGYNRKTISKAERLFERVRNKKILDHMNSRRSALIKIWWTILIVSVVVIGASYYLGLFPMNPVINQKGALSFPEEKPSSLPEAEYIFLRDTFYKFLDGGPKVIERYCRLIELLEEVKGAPIQNEEKLEAISSITEELEDIEPTIYEIVEALQTIKLKVIIGQITSNEDKKEIEKLLIIMDEIYKEPLEQYSF